MKNKSVYEEINLLMITIRVAGIEKQINILEDVLKRVEAQQELIDLKQNSISLN